MGRPTNVGRYQQSKEHITEPVLRVDPSKIREMKRDLTPSQTHLFLSKPQGWGVALGIAVVFTTVVFTLYLVMKREHQFGLYRQEVQDFQYQVDAYEKRIQDIERKIVQQDTKIENMKDN